MLQEPRSGRMTAWGNALLGGYVSPDEAVEKIVGGDSVHRIGGLPGEEGAGGLSLGLGRLRALGGTRFPGALPAPRHPLGLSGPPAVHARGPTAPEAGSS